jgi:hypothetical protein
MTNLTTPPHEESRLTMSYQYCGLDGLQWAHRAFVVLFIVLQDVPVKNQNRVDTGLWRIAWAAATGSSASYRNLLVSDSSPRYIIVAAACSCSASIEPSP